jgi:hypothetical protein
MLKRARSKSIVMGPVVLAKAGWEEGRKEAVEWLAKRGNPAVSWRGHPRCSKRKSYHGACDGLAATAGVGSAIGRVMTPMSERYAGRVTGAACAAAGMG